ncbi:MAG: ABC transporter permease [Actinomycetota bacterium]
MTPVEPDPASEPELAASPPSDVQPQRPFVKRAQREGLLASASEEEIVEEEATHRVLPRVNPLTTRDLEVEPPPRQRYRTPLRRSFAELIRARELLFTFVERDLKVRYKQAKLGAMWAILQPLMLMVVFTVVFGRIAKIGSEGLPYPIFAYTALVPWGLFSGAVGYGTNSIIGASGTIRKIYCPREIFPLTSVLSAGFDFLVSSVILFSMLMVYTFTTNQVPGPTITWVAFPLLLLLTLVYALTFTLFASAATVYYRDVRYGMPMLLTILMYATPVAYPIDKAVSALPEGLQNAYPYLNPLAPIMDGFRRVLAHGEWPAWEPLGSAAAVGLVALFLVYRWYKRIDGTFADVI